MLCSSHKFMVNPSPPPPYISGLYQVLDLGGGGEGAGGWLASIKVMLGKVRLMPIYKVLYIKICLLFPIFQLFSKLV